MTSRRREAETSRRQEPTTSATVAYTVRFTADESDTSDALVLALRRAVGRRRLDKSEIVRTLLRMAAADESTRATLIRELTTS